MLARVQTRYHISGPRVERGESSGVRTDFFPERLHNSVWESQQGRLNEQSRENSARTLGFAPRLQWVQYRKNILPEKPEKLLLCQQALARSQKKFSLPGIKPGA